MKIRIISAVVAIILAVPFVYFGGLLYAFGIGVLAIAGFMEVINLKKAHNDLPFVPCALAMLSLLLIIYTNFDGNSLVYGATYARLIFTIMSLMIPTIFYKKDRYTTRDAIYLIGMVLFLGIAFNSFILIRDKGLALFFFLALIPMCTDTFALLFGKKFGKHKMSPNISPNKSWEGSIAGLVFGSAIPCVFYNFVIGTVSWEVILGAMLLSCAGQVGDLLFSKIKRENDIKDFSNIMPGHGGVLDRLDSTIVIFMTYIFLTTILF